MDIKEIKNKPLSELNHLLGDLRKKLSDLKLKVSQNQLKNIREVRMIKKDIAKVLTVMAQANKKVK